MQFQDWIFDRRVLKRNIHKGVISREDYQKYLGSLVDVKASIADPDDDRDLRSASLAEDRFDEENEELSEEPSE